MSKEKEMLQLLNDATVARKYKLGDKWSADFDYDGMYELAQTATLDKGIEWMKKLESSFTDVNHHTEAEPLDKTIKALEKKDTKTAEVELKKFLKLVK